MLNLINIRGRVMKMSAWDKLAYTLVVIGGLNWGLVGFFKYNLVDKVFSTGLARIIYAVVGLAALWMLYGILTMMSEKPAKNKK